MYDDEEFEPDLPPLAPEPDEEDEPVWTIRRVLYLLIALLLVITLIAYMLWPTLIYFFQPVPPTPGPPTQPLPLL